MTWAIVFIVQMCVCQCVCVCEQFDRVKWMWAEWRRWYVLAAEEGQQLMIVPEPNSFAFS